MNADLARALAAQPRWRWAEGMRAHLGTEWLRVDEIGRGGELIGRGPDGDAEFGGRGAIPDLDDAATAGCLLAQTEAALPTVLRPDRSGWLVIVQLGAERHQFFGSTLGEACARALLAIWGPA